MCGCITSNLGPKSDIVQVDSCQFLDRKLFSNDVIGSHTEIHVSCENLANKDFMSKSDPFAILYIREKLRYYLNHI